MLIYIFVNGLMNLVRLCSVLYSFLMNHLCEVGYASFDSTKLIVCLCAFDQMCCCCFL